MKTPGRNPYKAKARKARKRTPKRAQPAAKAKARKAGNGAPSADDLKQTQGSANLVTVQQARETIETELGRKPSTAALYRLLNTCRLQAIRVAGRRIIPQENLLAYIESAKADATG